MGFWLLESALTTMGPRSHENSTRLGGLSGSLVICHHYLANVVYFFSCIYHWYGLCVATPKGCKTDSARRNERLQEHPCDWIYPLERHSRHASGSQRYWSSTPLGLHCMYLCCRSPRQQSQRTDSQKNISSGIQCLLWSKGSFLLAFTVSPQREEDTSAGHTAFLYTVAKPNGPRWFDYPRPGLGDTSQIYAVLLQYDKSWWSWLLLLSNKSAENAANTIKDWCAAFGTPSGLIAEDPAQFGGYTSRLVTIPLLP